MKFVTEKNKAALYYCLLVILSVFIGFISLGKGFSFDSYPGYSGDNALVLALLKSIDENGFFGIWFNSRIGAPETSSLIDFPVWGNIMAILVWIISWFTDSIPRIMYTYLLLTFALNSLGMSFLLRKLKIGRVVSFIISILFTAAPHHFYRYFIQLSLSNYMFIPIAIYLCLIILGIIESGSNWEVCICAVLLGLGYGYYYAFGLILLAVSYCILCVKSENLKVLIRKGWIIITVLGTILISLVPKIVFSLINGKNLEAGRRAFWEQELYGLKIINMFMPVSYSRIGFLRRITETYINSGVPSVNENAYASLGIVGVIAFIMLCVAFFISFIQKDKCKGNEWGLVDFLIIETLVFILVASVGGFGEIFNWTVTSQIRCYNRAIIVIQALVLVLLAVVLNKVMIKKQHLGLIVSTGVLLVGCYDQINICDADWQRGFDERQVVFENYFSTLEDSLDEGAMVYQLPYMDFPEAGNINWMYDYEPFVGYLFTDTLKWSYGGVRGRNTAARDLFIDGGMSENFIQGIKATGFKALYIDVYGFEDAGYEIVSYYEGLGYPKVVSSDGRLFTYLLE